MRRIRLIVLPVASLLAAFAVWANLRTDRSRHDLTFSGVVEIREIRVGSRVGGRIQEVAVREGEFVHAGQLLIRIESYDLSAQREEAQALVRQARANVAKLHEGNRPDEIAQARAAAAAAESQLKLLRNGARREEVERAEAELEAAAAEYDNSSIAYRRYVLLAQSDIISKQSVDDFKARMDRAAALQKAARKTLDLLIQGSRSEDIRAAEERYAEARARLRLLEDGPRREDIMAVEAELDHAMATLRAIEARLDETVISAPASATVETLNIRPGTLVAAGAPILTLLEPDQAFVTFYVPESALGFVRPADRLTVTLDAIPGKTFEGRVSHMAKRGEFSPRNVQTRDDREHYMFAGRVDIDNPQRVLRPGMEAEVHVRTFPR